jgi:glutamate N-acetyltransferase/amino-acid N-acetyltransferase
MSEKSPFAPAKIEELPALAGIRMATAATSMRYKNRDDLLLIECAKNTHVAGVFTTSQTAGACVHWGRVALKNGGGRARLLIVNAGIANVCNGASGAQAVQSIVARSAALWNCQAEEVFHCATGIIGQPLQENLITDALPDLKTKLTNQAWEKAARAISTTDTFPKMATRSFNLDGHKITLNGIIKGSGMIAPNMATMLGYIFTDAAIAPAILQDALQVAVDQSFHSITVDSDTSTSDTILLFATGKAEHEPIAAENDPRIEIFIEALTELCIDLAKQVVKDGEGISKFITIEVTGAQSDESARRIGLSIANSPLVKTAIAGEDANWGRIAMAVGKAGEAISAENLSIAMGGISIFREGQPNPNYQESIVTDHLKGCEINIAVNVGNIGDGQATVWTCDLTHEYIAINADYRS